MLRVTCALAAAAATASEFVRAVFDEDEAADEVLRVVRADEPLGSASAGELPARPLARADGTVPALPLPDSGPSSELADSSLSSPTPSVALPGVCCALAAAALAAWAAELRRCVPGSRALQRVKFTVVRFLV
jgi:hypothetical protein